MTDFHLPKLAPGTPVSTKELRFDDVRVLDDQGGTWVQVVYGDGHIGYVTRESITLQHSLNGT